MLPRVKEKEGMNRQSREDFQSSGTTLYDTIMVDIRHYIFVKIHGTYNTKSDL